MIILSKINRPYFKKQLVQCRFLGVSQWDEDLSSKIKHQIENHWKDKIWSPKFNENDNSKEKFYALSMFPYPSGKLHMGHVRVYTISDTVARFQRMNGKNVLHPIGWDAFGLPAENAAIERNIKPQNWTKQNISQMKKQLKKLGCSFDWDRELATCNPDYYKWTQYLFLKLFKSGLVYQKEALVNWDPVDKTVLAHEQVDENGHSWRSGAKIEKKLLKQWFIRTTKFAKQLYEGLSDPKLQDWRDIIKLQKHWIGECNGIRFDIKISGHNFNDKLSVWTDKPFLIPNIQFIAVKSGSKLSNFDSDLIFEGVKKSKLFAENPLTGDIIPIFITDEIQYENFAETYLGLPTNVEDDILFAKKLNINLSMENIPFNEEDTKLSSKRVCEKLQALNIGGFFTSPKLQDWLISRQRYWGTPIPIIYCHSCGIQPVPEKDLPVPLPDSPEEKSKWAETICPKCNGKATRETDTMDTFVDSAWYFLRYIDNKNDSEIFGKDLVKMLMPVDLYIGGKEHAVLHLYYARFMNLFLHSLGLVSSSEPFKRLLVQGMVMGQSYRIKGTGKYVTESEINVIDPKKKKAVHKVTNEPIVISWEKMSKSKHNGVDPDEMFDKYGVDTTRLLILADVAPTSHRNWQPSTFPGILNWQHRLWLTVSNFIKQRNEPPPNITEKEFEEFEEKLFDSRNFYIKGTTFNYYTSQQISVAISKLQGLTNSLRRAPNAVFAKSLQFERALAVQIIMLAPMAPHFASELWQGFISAKNHLSTNSTDYDLSKSVLEQSWPEIDRDYYLDLVLQTNGFEVGIVKIPRTELETMNRDTAVDLALNQKEVKEFVYDKEISEVTFEVFKGYEGVVNVKTKKKLKNVAVS